MNSNHNTHNMASKLASPATNLLRELAWAPKKVKYYWRYLFYNLHLARYWALGNTTLPLILVILKYDRFLSNVVVNLYRFYNSTHIHHSDTRKWIMKFITFCVYTPWNPGNSIYRIEVQDKWIFSILRGSYIHGNETVPMSNVLSIIVYIGSRIGYKFMRRILESKWSQVIKFMIVILWVCTPL